MAKVSKRKPIPVVEEAKKVLTHEEQIVVQTSPLEVKNAQLLMALEEQSLANLKLEYKLMEAKIEKQVARVQTLAHKYEAAKKEYEGVISNIMTNHGLPSEKFSYNVNTGEIIL
jgi:hypothetical protein